jgi:hypothetical protein
VHQIDRRDLPQHVDASIDLAGRRPRILRLQHRLVLPPNRAQRLSGYLKDLLELKTGMSESWSPERCERVERLNKVYMEAKSKTPVLLSLKSTTLRDNWSTVESYRTTVCHRARGPLVDSTFVRWKISAKNVTEQLISRGLEFKEQWTKSSLGVGRG